MSRVTGSYSDGTPRLYGDYCQVLTNRGDRTLNLVEINDYGDLIFVEFDEEGNWDGLDVCTVEDYCADFLRRWNDPELTVGQFI